MTSNRVEDFADDPNWIVFGKSLRHAVQTPSSFGFADPETLIAKVARFRGVDPASLRNPLAAVNWMVANAPEALVEENPRVAMTGVLLLSQISILDRGLAEDVAPKFFSGDMAREELRRLLEDLQKSSGRRRIAAHDRFRRAEAFEERVFDFLTCHPAVLGLGDRVTVSRSSRREMAPSDFLVSREGKTVAAIEVKSHRQKLHNRYLVETLATTSLAAKAYDRAFLIVPREWGDAVQRIGELIRSLRLEGVQHAAFSADGTGHLEVFGKANEGLQADSGTHAAATTDTVDEPRGTLQAEEQILSDMEQRRTTGRSVQAEKLAAANSDEGANRIVEIDPSLVHSAGVEDRMDGGLQDIDVLASSIEAAGQKIPILVRPHPELKGEYEIVAGRRRLEACRIAGRPVRAEIQALDDQDLVLGQAIENIARENLTFIERARLAARMVDEAGLQPTDIDMAFSCGKTDRSRYLKIGRGIPSDILQWIGKAPSAGRPRWERLVTAFASDEAAEPRIREMLAAANDQERPVTSDERFNLVYRAAIETPKREKAELRTPEVRDIYVDGVEAPVARISHTSKGVELVLTGERRPGFLAYVADHGQEIVHQMMRHYEREQDINDMT